MGMNDTPSSERMHIAFFGLRNAGKSSLVNAVTGQNIPLDELRYWSARLQEAYASPEIATRRLLDQA